MTREQLEHVIRATAVTAGAADIVVMGSQSILGTCPNAPAELTQSIKADVFPKERPVNAILIDGAIGERSLFHETFGYYAHGVAEDTAVLPEGWKDRLVPIHNENTRGATGWCLEPHDLGVSQLVAGREKDMEFVGAMLRHGVARADILRTRLAATPLLHAILRSLIEEQLNRLAAVA